MDTLFNTAFRGRVFIKDGATAGTFKVGLNKGATSNPTYTTTDYPVNTPILIVLKYKFDPSALDSMFAYIFTSGVPATEPSSATLVATDISSGDLAVLNSVCIRQGTIGTMTGTIDGIRVSNSWADGPLPVKLTSFEANVNDETTLLTWSTSSEINNKGFEIERSTDGENFEMIGFVRGAGNSNILNTYLFKFESNETAFYRLKQIDFDGVYEYSKIVFVSNNLLDDQTELLPNPFVNEISIQNEDGIVKVEIIDVTGKVVVSEEILNSTKVLVNTETLKAGLYYLKVQTAHSIETKRVIKNN
jgi:hypothetical protein